MKPISIKLDEIDKSMIDKTLIPILAVLALAVEARHGVELNKSTNAVDAVFDYICENDRIYG